MSEITLKHLFQLNLKDHPYVLLENSESKTDLDTIHERVKKLAPDGDFGGIQGQLLEHIESLMDVPLSTILVNGWNKLREIRLVIEQQKKSGKKTPQIVKIYDHKLKSNHTPKLQIYMNESLIGTLPLSIDLQLKISALELEIQEGAIRKIMMGRCAGDGTISYLGAKLHEQKFLKFSLPGKVSIHSVSNEKTHNIDLGIIENTMSEAALKPRSKGWIIYIILGLVFLVAAFLFWQFI